LSLCANSIHTHAVYLVKAELKFHTIDFFAIVSYPVIDGVVQSHPFMNFVNEAIAKNPVNVITPMLKFLLPISGASYPECLRSNFDVESLVPSKEYAEIAFLKPMQMFSNQLTSCFKCIIQVLYIAFP